jgi:rhodanese-related sulfurtransferase
LTARAGRRTSLPMERISPDEAKRRLDAGWVYLDVRSVPEFEQGHPAGAYNVPLLHMGRGGMEPNPEFLAVVTKTFARSTRLVVGCKSGPRSLRAAQMLEAAGFASVADQRAGWSGAHDAFGQITERGWRAAGFPSETEAQPGRAWHELSKRDVGT